MNSEICPFSKQTLTLRNGEKLLIPPGNSERVVYAVGPREARERTGSKKPCLAIDLLTPAAKMRPTIIEDTRGICDRCEGGEIRLSVIKPPI